MAEQLKHMFNKDNIGELAQDFKVVYPEFDKDGFLTTIFDQDWDDRSLMERERHITLALGKYLPDDYPTAISIIDQVAPKYTGWMTMLATVFPDFVQVYGTNEQHFDVSIRALKEYTKCCTSEFGVRPFIEKYEEKMLPIMMEWACDENEHVRRLASEGCRPALPWGKALKKYKEDPTPIIPILELLKDDDSKYVQKSVANNINDIAKTHPDLVVDLMKSWYGKSKNTDWIVKHGCRTLLKRGNVEALKLFDYENASAIEVSELTISDKEIVMGEGLSFSFSLCATTDTKIRLEYGVDFMKANGKHNRKVFQISETVLKANEKKTYTKKHQFADLTTRKHYPGEHVMTLIVNGAERGSVRFELRGLSHCE